MLDVHVLVSRGIDKQWQRDAMVSLRNAVKRSPVPVHIYEAPSNYQHLGLARQQGYAQGTSEWKTYIDDDDIVLPDAFEIIARHLDSPHACLTFGEYVMQNERLHGITNQGHHLICYRKDVLDTFQFQDWRVMSDVALRRHVAQDPRGVADFPDCIYIHRVYANSNGRKSRRQKTDEVARLIAGGKCG